MRTLKTTSEVIDALGGTKAVAELTKRSYRAAFNWRSFPKFPANTFVIFRAELDRCGFDAPLSLWGMADAA